MPKYKYQFFVCILLIGGLSSCATVKPYQRTYLNDPEMAPAMSAAQKLEQDAQTIREGSTTPGGSKSSGGCGCN